MEFLKDLFGDYFYNTVINVSTIPAGAYVLVIGDVRTSYKIVGTRAGGDTDTQVATVIKTKLNELGATYVDNGVAFGLVGSTEGTGVGVKSTRINLNDLLFRKNNLLMVGVGALVTKML